MGAVSGRGKTLSFVPQSELPADTAYESWIAETGAVPTRDNRHDRYNAMVWLNYPKTKARLNAVQADEIDRIGLKGPRGPVRDAATLWDENLVVLVAEHDVQTLQALLQARDWSALFLEYRRHWHCHWHVMPFGHALLEKLAVPYKAITAHVVVESMTSADQGRLDQQLLARVHSRMRNQDYSPLPVMGIPGWDPTNDAPEFYADPNVFRTTVAS
jgi:hypothetical protein